MTLKEEPYPSNKKADALSVEELTEQLVLGFTRIRGRPPTDKEKQELAQGAKHAKYDQGWGMNWDELPEALEVVVYHSEDRGLLPLDHPEGPQAYGGCDRRLTDRMIGCVH